MLVDVPIDQFINGGRVPGIGPRVHRIFTAIDVALEPLGLLPGSHDRPGGPCADRHAPLSPGHAVNQDEPLAARQEDTKAETSAVLVKHHIFARADFGSFYNPFRQMRSHVGPPVQAD